MLKFRLVVANRFSPHQVRRQGTELHAVTLLILFRRVESSGFPARFQVFIYRA